MAGRKNRHWIGTSGNAIVAAMNYELFIGDRSFSSWSLRGWLMFAKFGLHVDVHLTGLYTDTFMQDLAPLEPAHLVPVMRMADGTVMGETLAIAETLAERHPLAGFWPSDPGLRARARWICGEVHAGFAALRSECAMQLLHQYVGFEASEAVLRDLARLEQIFASARAICTPDGPWILGNYCLADVFLAPIAARIIGYGLPANDAVMAYVHQHMADPAFGEWRAEGLQVNYDPVPYDLNLPTRVWPELV